MRSHIHKFVFIHHQNQGSLNILLKQDSFLNTKPFLSLCSRVKPIIYWQILSQEERSREAANLILL